MTTTDLLAEILRKLGEVSVRCPEFRFGQLIAAIGTLAEDDAEHSLWDIEDTDFLAALNRFAADIADRRGRNAETAAALDRDSIVSSPASIIAQMPRQVN